MSYYPIISVYRVWGSYLSINSYLIRFCISSVVSLVPAPVLVLYDRMIAPRSLKSVRQDAQCNSGSAGSTNFALSSVSGGEQRRTSKITQSFADSGTVDRATNSGQLKPYYHTRKAPPSTPLPQTPIRIPRVVAGATLPGVGTG